ncbi:glycerol-3-phosphate dehydrogenase/oxidase [Puia dinghuensis]|uniref:Glycerol-3-phosphate dehydrogenase n=1 Tax=Puia dinghuensis TaxID=1792502 RepID=A0A8J2UGW2_9BACT|nr:glycerol-3-phosphate dehydrogenase/oxidase [Puia dinghuensis]GGB14092.1 glycerol-3-phosphate dehydrogenase [Puia dinghuensis]
MKRQEMIAALDASSAQQWDVCIIGGGATGLGVAVDAASRGFSTLLLEEYDFAKGTSSRATKLVHGGVRYLQQGNVKLVTEALYERGVLRRNAPHLVKNQSFIVPNYKWWEGPYYGIGLKVYDWMAGSLGLGKSRLLSREETLQMAPTLDADGLRGSVLYHDGQFDDARLAIHLAQTAVRHGAVVLNYCRVKGLLKTRGAGVAGGASGSAGEVCGVEAVDTIGGKEYVIQAKVVINATGVFTDTVLRMDDAASEPIIAPSQGVHLMLDKEFLPGEAAILVPHTDDGRVLFAVPWHNKIIIGTTDTPVTRVDIEPRALPEEVDFILQQIGRYLQKVPGYGDIRSIFAGLRPLVKSSSRKTAELARDHLIVVSDSGLVTITGGKWTTYRRMAEDTVNTAIARGRLPERPCVTATLPIYGAMAVNFDEPMHFHGTDAAAIRELGSGDSRWAMKLHPRLPYTWAEIVWAAREEGCMTVEDALSRRTRSLLLDAQAAIECAGPVAALLAAELGRDQEWQRQQVEEFGKIAGGYLAAR